MHQIGDFVMIGNPHPTMYGMVEEIRVTGSPFGAEPTVYVVRTVTENGFGKLVEAENPVSVAALRRAFGPGPEWLEKIMANYC